MTDDRKLMPYEHQLIEALDITKEDYLDFVAQQHIYTDVKEGTVLDARNLEVVAIVLTIIGTILQVVAALLAKPQEAGGNKQTRDDIFAPRSGFSSAQELAKYGDPVNLVYANYDPQRHPTGGVRVNTSLIWSAIKSFGSSQYVQLLLLIGAGGIGSIDYERTALGQTPIRDLISQNYWLYFKPNGTGAIVKRNFQEGSQRSSDPGAIGGQSDNIYRLPPGSNSPGPSEGFSHAISPATSNRFGVYAPVPINIDIEIRSETGDVKSAKSGITASSAQWGSGNPLLINGRIAEGDQLRITLKKTESNYDKDEEEEAAEFRRTISAAFDEAGVMKLGAAKFAIVSIDGSTEDGDMVVRLVCTEKGRAPSIVYSLTDPQKSAQRKASDDPTYQALRRRVRQLLNEDERKEITSASQLLKSGKIFISVLSGTDKWRFYKNEFKRNLTKAEKDVLNDFIFLEGGVAKGAKSDELFFIKALVKIEIAQYETLTPCHIVDFAIKARAWRRISGRQEEYGSKQRDGYRSADNGIKRRSAMFLLKYKEANPKEKKDFTYVKGIFVVSRAADIDNFVYFRFNSGLGGLDNTANWQFEIEPVHDTIAEFATRNLVSSDGKYRFFYLENSGKEKRIVLEDKAFPSASVSFTGSIRNSSNKLPPLNKSPRETNEWDLFSNTSDTQLQMSFDQGPEFTVTAVTEQIRVSFDNFQGLYKDISLLGFNMYSGRNVQDLRSLSVFVEQGRRSRLLRVPSSGPINGIPWGQPGYQYLSPSVNGHANTAPDIFVDTILDAEDGIGKYAGDLFSVDLEQLARSKAFCERNKLFMDGVIAEPTSWRQFWAENAGLSLLELAKQDGKESLIPGLPYNRNDGAISRQVNVSALFNPGNILEDSYKEEFIDYGNNAEDAIITVIYRDRERNGVFSRNNSVDVTLANAQEENAFKETIDASAFVTREEQAILLGKFLCQTRRHSRRAIEFKTFPTDSFVAPGSYIYVEFAQNQWNRIQTGIIGEGGKLNLPFGETIKDGSYQMLIYNPVMVENKTIYREAEPIVDGASAALRNFNDHVFVLGQVRKNKRVFRATEVSMDEEGEVTIKGVEHGTDPNTGLSLISHGLNVEKDFVSGLFLIDGRPEKPPSQQ
jgi:hypothetical protein